MKIAILGAGPGGYEAALYAAKLGHEVVLIEKDKLGGTCLNCGCIPTKALLASAETFHSVAHTGEFGVAVEGEVEASFNDIFKRKDTIVSGLVNGIGYLMKGNQVTVVQGRGRLTGSHSILVEFADSRTETITADKIILATGSSEAVPPVFPYDGVDVITSREVLSLREKPDSMIIVGGGVIGCEVGQFLARTGTKVTIVEMQEHILPGEDADTARVLARSLKKDGVDIRCGVAVQSMEKSSEGVHVSLGDGTVLEGKKALIAIGRKPNTADIGLETVGLETDHRGFLQVDGLMRTAAEDVYAIGDIVPSAQLAHVASKEGFTAVDHLSGRETQGMNYKAVPRCVYTDPEVAGVGMTEQAARQQGQPYRKGIFAFKALGKAKTSGKTEGFVKILTDEEDVIIGGCIVGAHASDMLSVLTLSVELGLTVSTVNKSIFPHPSMSEAIMEALHDVHRHSVHKL